MSNSLFNAIVNSSGKAVRVYRLDRSKCSDPKCKICNYPKDERRPPLRSIWYDYGDMKTEYHAQDLTLGSEIPENET